MITGTGIDIVNTQRIERTMARWGDLFLSRVFTERERSNGVSNAPDHPNVSPFASQQRRPFLKPLDVAFEMVSNGQILKWRMIHWVNLCSPSIERQKRSSKPSESKRLFLLSPTSGPSPWPM